MKTIGNNAMRAIRAKCLDCSAGQWYEVQRCPVADCPLWEFRMGCRPTTLRRKRPELLDRRKHRRGANKEALGS